MLIVLLAAAAAALLLLPPEGQTPRDYLREQLTQRGWPSDWLGEAKTEPAPAAEPETATAPTPQPTPMPFSTGTPGWAQRYLANPPAAWTEWRNSLKPQGEAVTVPLASEGRTDYVIVVPEKATAQEKRSASELRLWLGKITGADFPIVPDTEAPRERELSVGNTSRVTEAAREKSASVGGQGYAIVIEGDRVLLLGEGGPLNAVMALLEEDLGVRWYVPRERKWNQQLLAAEPWAMDDLDRYPVEPTLNAGIVPRAVKPLIPVRRSWYPYTYKPWGLRNRINGGFDRLSGYQRDMAKGELGVHTFHELVPPDKYFKTNPEFYSLIDGQRQWEKAQLCLSNPEVAKAAARTAIEELRKAPPTHRMVNVSPMDWLGDCECEDCRAMEKEAGSYSGLLLTFVNRVAEEISKEIPDATVQTLAYWQSRQPPASDITAHPNVAVQFCLDRGSSFDWPYHSFYDEKFNDPTAVKKDSQADGGSWTTLSERDLYARWKAISPRMHAWLYPTQYRNEWAPLPTLHVLGENLRYLGEQGVEMAYVQSPGSDDGREELRQWVTAKLLWDPTLNVDNLIQDFIWGGYYGAAAPEVAEYHHLFTDYAARYNDFERRRNWIHAIHDEGMFQHGFVEKARAILDRGLERVGDDEQVRRRVERLKLGVVSVEATQMFMQMRDGAEPPDLARYETVRLELSDLCKRLGVKVVGFFDDSQYIAGADKFIDAMEQERRLRFDNAWLPATAWGEWRYRPDPEDAGVEQKWFTLASADGPEWLPVQVPGFLPATESGPPLGYGWYFVTFTLDEAQRQTGIELHFGGVDEQAWVYVNGEYLGEHTLKSEWIAGEEITIEDLWDRPFKFEVPSDRLKTGVNVLMVRFHNEALNGGIHQAVRINLPEPEKPDLTRGEILHEDFSGAKAGGVPEGWQRYVQESDGRAHGIAEVRQHGSRPALLLQDKKAHVAVWSASDKLLPDDNDWVLQFDFRLLGTDPNGQLIYQASPEGGLLGLKRGSRGLHSDYLPVLQLCNKSKSGAPVTLYGLGEVLTENLAPNEWHRVAIRRQGTDWEFFLDGQPVKTVSGQDTDLRGLAFGSFRDWQNVMQDVEIADLKIGKLQNP